MNDEQGTTEQQAAMEPQPERAITAESGSTPESGSAPEQPERAETMKRIVEVWSEEEGRHIIPHEGIIPVGAPVPGPELRRRAKRARGRGILENAALPAEVRDITGQLTQAMQQLIGAVLAGAKREAARKYPKPMSRLRKPNGEIDWEKVHRVDENMLKRGMPLNPRYPQYKARSRKYMALIRLILRLPRDGWWYKITPKKHMTHLQLKQARAALARWLKKLEYDTILRLHHDSGGLYACWHPEPGKEHVPKMDDEQLRTKVQLRKIEEFSAE